MRPFKTFRNPGSREFASQCQVAQSLRLTSLTSLGSGLWQHWRSAVPTDCTHATSTCLPETEENWSRIGVHLDPAFDVLRQIREAPGQIREAGHRKCRNGAEDIVRGRNCVPWRVIDRPPAACGFQHPLPCCFADCRSIGPRWPDRWPDPGCRAPRHRLSGHGGPGDGPIRRHGSTTP